MALKVFVVSDVRLFRDGLAASLEIGWSEEGSAPPALTARERQVLAGIDRASPSNFSAQVAIVSAAG